MKIGLLWVNGDMSAYTATAENAGLIARELARAGYKISEHLIAGQGVEIYRALEYLISNDIIIVSGGPCKDPEDLMKDLAVIAEKGMLYNDLRLLEGAKKIPNAPGKKPGFIIEGEKTISIIPGRAEEIGIMMPFLIKFIKDRYKFRAGPKSVFVKTIGLAGTDIEEFLRRVSFKGVSYEISEEAGQATIRLDIEIRDYSKALSKAKSIIEEIDEIREKTYSYEASATIQQAVIGRLVKGGLTISAAESCTGGLFTKMLTDVPGSSAAVLGGIVSYDNSVKTSLLGVDENLIMRYGAVSFECAGAMVEGLRKKFISDFYISITGIAGPSGGTRAKPVGTVFIGLGKKNSVSLFRCRFNGTRENVRICSAMKALELLWGELTYGTENQSIQYGIEEKKIIELA
jgi:nicotinamide-nucleotide amidase